MCSKCFPERFSREQSKDVPSVLPFNPLQEGRHTLLLHAAQTSKVAVSVLASSVAGAVPADPWGQPHVGGTPAAPGEGAGSKLCNAARTSWCETAVTVMLSNSPCAAWASGWSPSRAMLALFTRSLHIWTRGRRQGSPSCRAWIRSRARTSSEGLVKWGSGQKTNPSWWTGIRSNVLLCGI